MLCRTTCSRFLLRTSRRNTFQQPSSQLLLIQLSNHNHTLRYSLPILLHQHQSRFIFSYLSQLFGFGEKDDTNYILEFLKQQQQNSIVLPIDNELSSSQVVDSSTNGSKVSEEVKSQQNDTDATTTSTELSSSPTLSSPIDSTAPTIEPQIDLAKFSLMKPNHFIEALEYVKKQQLQILLQFHKEQQSLQSIEDSSSTATDALFAAKANVDRVLRTINTVQEQFFVLRQIGSFIYTTSCRNNYDKKDWYDAIKLLTTEDHISYSSISLTTFPIRSTAVEDKQSDSSTNLPSTTPTLDPFATQLEQWHALHTTLQSSLRVLQKQVKNSAIATMNGNDDYDENPNNSIYAARYLLKNYENETGIKSALTTTNEAENIKRITKYRAVKDMMSSVANDIFDIKATMVTLPIVNVVYNYLGLRTEQAKLLGYLNVAHQIIDGDHHLMSSTVRDSDEIRKLHTDVIRRISPTLRKMTRLNSSNKKRRSSPIESLLGGRSSGNTGNIDNTSDIETARQYRTDRRNMIKLAQEKHVTYTGLLKFALQIVHDMFGISMVRIDDKDSYKKDLPAEKWDHSIEIYNCYDTLNDNEYIGIIYIDPFKREFKSSKSSTVPIRLRSSTDNNTNLPPIAIMSLSFIQPLLYEDPAYVTWQQCEDFLHEFGHAIQFVMGKSKYGCILGAQNMPLDISELIPKFMELFMTQRSSIYTLIELSETKVGFAEEEIDAAYRINATDKMLKLAQVTFYGSFELELFSNFQLKGSESIMSLQERIANKIIPHIGLDKNDMAAILDILEDNIRGRHVACYRYLWCEVHAAMIFEYLVQKLKTDPESVLQLRLYIRQYLLEPGANVNFEEFKSKVGLREISLDPLWRLYRLSSGNDDVSK